MNVRKSLQTFEFLGHGWYEANSIGGWRIFIHGGPAYPTPYTLLRRVLSGGLGGDRGALGGGRGFGVIAGLRHRPL